MQFSPKLIHELRFYKVLKFLEKYFEIHKFERFAFFIIIIFIIYNDECVVFWQFFVSGYSKFCETPKKVV